MFEYAKGLRGIVAINGIYLSQYGVVFSELPIILLLSW